MNPNSSNYLEWIPAVAVVSVFIGLMALVSYFKYEPFEVVDTETVEATIVGYSGGRTGISSADPYFVVRLSNGQQVKVKDVGEIPSTYTGPILLHRAVGDVSGRVTYKIIENSRP